MPVFQRKPVLVPIDYSEASLQAVRVAKSVAGAESDVTVVHVAQDYDLTLHPLTWTGGPLPNYREEPIVLPCGHYHRPPRASEGPKSPKSTLCPP